MEKSITPLPDANFTPTRQPQLPLGEFRFWCQKVLPLVYEDSLSYYELLCKVVDYLNKTMEDVTNMDIDITALYNAYNELQNYVNEYFSSLDVQQEINNKLDSMVKDGHLLDIITPLITSLTNTKVEEWLQANITPGTGVVDKSLTISGASADAQVTGINIERLTNKINSINFEQNYNALNRNSPFRENSFFNKEGVIEENALLDVFYVYVGSKPVTVSVDAKYFYVCQADTPLVNENNRIVRYDATTYIDTYDTVTPLVCTIRPTHPYIFLSLLKGTTCMVNFGVTPLPYIDYIDVASIKIKNALYDDIITNLNYTPGKNIFNQNRYWIPGIIEKTGEVSKDDRGLRTTVIKLDKTKEYSISINNGWFYTIQSDSPDFIMGRKIVGVDATTYTDSSKTDTPLSMTFTPIYEYLFMTFLPADSATLPNTNQIMINYGAPIPYVPYNSDAYIDINNIKEFNTTLYDQLFCNYGKLICNESIFNSKCVYAYYMGFDMGEPIQDLRAMTKLNDAFATFISTPTYPDNVESITMRSIHINISKSICYVGYFENKVLTNIATLKYTGLEKGVIGFVLQNGQLTVYTPDGLTHNYTGVITTKGGNYGVIENYKSGEFSTAEFQELICKTDNNILYDNFMRLGYPAISPTGQNYTLFNVTKQNRGDYHFTT